MRVPLTLRLKQSILLAFTTFFNLKLNDTAGLTQAWKTPRTNKVQSSVRCLLADTKRFDTTDLVIFTRKNISPNAQSLKLKKRFRKKAALRLRRFREDAMFRNVLLRWLNHWLGSSISLIIDRSLHYRLTISQLAALSLLDFRISQYVSNGDITKLGLWTAGPNLILMSSLTRDPELLISWLRIKLPRMTLFAHRRFFRLLGVLLTTLTVGRHATMAGVNMYLVGKISVTGNAMSRSQLTHNGVGGNSNLKAQVVSGFTLVYTNTGCLGLTISYFYNK